MSRVEGWDKETDGALPEAALRAESFPLAAIADSGSLAEGLRRVALEIGRRGRTLLEGDLVLEPEVVHALRVSTKRLRAFWQLYRSTGDAALAKRSIDRLRDAARTLSGLRDDHVLHQLLRSLAAIASDRDRGEFLAAGSSLVSPMAGTKDLRQVHRDLLAVLATDGDDWLHTAQPSDQDLVRFGLGRTFAKAADLGQGALESKCLEELHRWRRWVKYLRYQLEPLATPQRSSIAELYAELKQLGSALGRRNDLHQLRQALEGSRFRAVERAIAAEDLSLAARLPKFGATVFSSSVDRFLAVVGRDLL